MYTQNNLNLYVTLVSEKLWRVMTSSPREKDVWIDALTKVLGDRYLLQTTVAVKKVASNLERSDSKRSEVRSLPLADGPCEEAPILRSYSTGATTTQTAMLNIRSAGSSPVPAQEIPKVYLLLYGNFLYSYFLSSFFFKV